MGTPLPKPTLDDYLRWENEQPERHEYVRGEIFAMVGARRVHGVVVTNLSAALRSALRGSPCRVFSEGMKVQAADDTILYPDLFVTCDPADLRTDMIFRAPKLVIEVLSPTTQAYDRSLKFALYRRLASLQEYALVDPDTRRIEVFRKGGDGLWVLHDMSDGDALALANIGCEVPLAEVFDGVDPGAAAVTAEPAAR
ncbi:MAG: Uma2 family endonuclease [Burkholderiales bacterium]|nr:Uma2 family endonuclease [Burkholderiales bacterium]